MEANWGSLVPSSSSEGTRDDPLVINDDEEEVRVRVEREDTVVPPACTGTPFMAQAAMVTTLVEVDEDEVDPNDIVTDNSIDLMEDQFMMATGVVIYRVVGLRGLLWIRRMTRWWSFRWSERGKRWRSFVTLLAKRRSRGSRISLIERSWRNQSFYK